MSLKALVCRWKGHRWQIMRGRDWHAAVGVVSTDVFLGSCCHRCGRWDETARRLVQREGWVLLTVVALDLNMRF